MVFETANQFVRLATHICMLLTGWICFDRRPRLLPLIVFEAAYWTVCLAFPFMRETWICYEEQKLVIPIFVPIFALVFEEKNMGRLIFASLLGCAAFVLFRAAMTPFLPVRMTMDLYRRGITLDELAAIGQVFLTVLLFTLTRVFHFKGTALYDSVVLRGIFFVISLMIMLLFRWLTPLLDNLYSTSLLWIVLCGLFVLIFLAAIWIIKARTHRKTLERLARRVRELESLQERDAHYVHETQRAVKFLSQLPDSPIKTGVLQDAVQYTALNALPPGMRFIVASYMSQLETSQIEFKLEVLGENLSDWPFTEREMFTLLGNLFDNAIEELEANHIEPRVIDMTVAEEHDLHTIIVENPYDASKLPAHNVKHGGISSHRGHLGYGLHIVDRLVRRKDGVFQVSPRDKTFLVRIDIPCRSYDDKD